MSDETGWLQISTEGFAAFNQARPPSHLVKELVQNGLDALDGAVGQVALDYEARNGSVYVRCADTGVGMEDLGALRVVYLTLKTDSHLKRGRFGRGFKEILSVAQWARASSGENSVEFVIEGGVRRMRRSQYSPTVRGAVIEMLFDWAPSALEEFDAYFRRFLPPPNATFVVNRRTIASRPARYEIEATLPTEIYDPNGHAWRKPTRKTMIELIGAAGGEAPFLYEMGIPVAAVEWALTYHANVLQRVPMNPNRDAYASGYAAKVHAACLPILVDDMTQEEVTADWVGAAGARCEPDVQKKVVAKAFGDSAVRAVPVMGKRDYNDDAARFGAEIVHTGQMSSGFREMARNHLASAKVHVDQTDAQRAAAATAQRFSPIEIFNAADERAKWIEQRGGRARVDACLAFAVWFCQQLVDTVPTKQRKVTGHVALGRRPPVGTQPFQAHWSADNQLTLALEEDSFWIDPVGAEALMILIHEAAHAMNLHHGRGFNEEVERLAGVAASLMFRQADAVRDRLRRIQPSAP